MLWLGQGRWLGLRGSPSPSWEEKELGVKKKQEEQRRAYAVTISVPRDHPTLQEAGNAHQRSSTALSLFLYIYSMHTNAPAQLSLSLYYIYVYIYIYRARTRTPQHEL